MPKVLSAALLWLSALVLTAPALVGSAQAAPKAADLVRAELLTEPKAIVPGQPFEVGVRLVMEPGWHTYWRNPGDSGLATEIKWTLPPGFSAGPIVWPTPERIPVSQLVNYGYSDEVTLLTRITPPATLPAGAPVSLKADVSYLVCERECIPGEAKLDTSAPVAPPGASAEPDPITKPLFETARAALPIASPWATRLEPAGDTLRLRVDAPGLKADGIRSAYFFPIDETAIEHAAPQVLSVDGTGLSLTLKRSAFATGEPPKDLPGILVLDEALDGANARQAFRIGTPAEPAPTVSAASPVSGARAADTTVAAVATAALLAFLGGLILNLMPCVFPVLSIKVLSLVKHSGQSARVVRLSGLAYTAGVVACFLALAGLLLAVRAAGGQVGWGFQLQSPAVVAALAFLLFAMGLSLSGAAEFGTSLAGFGGRLADRSGLAGSFFTGLLAAVVATPCTAPFMGAAVGYAVTAPVPVALAVFAALGLGMAAPFLVLTVWPGLLGRLPRPGAWMEVLKQVLAFPIYATVAWLVFVLSQQVGPTELFAVLIGFVLVAFALWCVRLAGRSSGVGRGIGRGAALASLLVLAAIGWTVGRAPEAARTTTAAAAPGAAEPYTEARLAALRAESRPVLVNLTAAWCITCLVNERTSLSTAAVRQALAGRNVAYLKGDWTNQNPEITRLLERHGRSGVPLYLLYPPGGEAVILPQILTEATVLDSLGRITAPATRRAELDTTYSKE